MSSTCCNPASPIFAQPCSSFGSLSFFSFPLFPVSHMEINKDEAIRCLSIAKNHYGNGNYAAALRLTKKSISLYPTEQAKAFLEKAEKAAASAPDNKPTDTRTSNGTKAAPSQPPSSEKKYTQEQVDAVKAILACGNDYYKVLSLDKNCTEVQIKKSYRKVK